MPIRIDPDSPVPLYHQIAESIRGAIEAGELGPGEALTPLREAAEAWGVNVHTVRHAYTSLARDGLLEIHRGARGTRVAESPPRLELAGGAKRSVEEFLDRVRAEARARYGLGGHELADALRARSDRERPRVYVVECSDWQAECHARELAGRVDVEAIAWAFDRGEPPEGAVLATYFHYNDIRRAWPRRLSGIHFVSIHPDPGLARLLADTDVVRVCEMDASTADAVAADLTALFDPGGLEIGIGVDPDPSRLADAATADAPSLFAPRAWAMLDEEARSRPGVFELRYVLDGEELDAVAARERWRHATPDIRRAAG